MNSIEAAVPIIHQDAYLIAVNKPAGMPTQADPTGDPDLLSVLGGHLGRKPGLVHRLDRPVSGVVLFALDDDTLAALNTIFRDRHVRKRYWAIVQGAMAGEGWTVLEHHLEHDVKTRRARVIKTTSSGKDPARLRIRTLAAGDRYTLLEVEPEGGAFHQIRAQLAAAGHPIKGDVKYGARRGERDRSIALHAHALDLEHPVTGRPLALSAPPPQAPLWMALVSAAGLAPSA